MLPLTIFEPNSEAVVNIITDAIAEDLLSSAHTLLRSCKAAAVVETAFTKTAVPRRQDREEIEDARFLAHTQFGQRLVLLNAMDAYKLIPPKREDKEYKETGARGGPMATKELLDQEERKDARQMERHTLDFCKEVEISHRHAKSRHKAEVWGDQPL
jgi:hypothetical protein